LKTEIEKVSQDFLTEQSQRRALAQQIMLMEKELEGSQGQVTKGEEALKEAQKTIKELERRRNMTQKEIK